MNKYLNGPFAVIMTPFKGGKVDEANFIKQVERVNGTGISGFVVNGSTAEFPKLSLEEQMRLTELVIKNKESNKKVIVSACTACASDTLTICNHAKKVGADAVLVCPPYYFNYPTSEREEYYLTVANNSPLPVFLYNVPFFTQELELSLVMKLLNHKNVIGIKDSSANMKRIMHTLSVAPDDVTVMTGTDDILIPALFAGCGGSMTALAAIFPEEVSELYESFNSGNYERAREIQSSFMPKLRKADSVTFPFGYKRLMTEASGIEMGDKSL